MHLKIDKGRIKALVSGSELYEIQIDIAALPKPDWQALKEQSAGKIGTLVELLQGKLSKAVMELVTDREQGLFPKPKEIKMRCSCPDCAGMCKHLAAVMYGVGNRLDSSPELLFVLRGVDHLELIEQAIPTAPLGAKSSAPTIATDDLGAIFDIEIGDAPAAKAAASSPREAGGETGCGENPRREEGRRHESGRIEPREAGGETGCDESPRREERLGHEENEGEAGPEEGIVRVPHGVRHP